MRFAHIKKIHFIGLGGIGISAVAKFFKLQGKDISGSDLYQTEITDECEAVGIKFIKGHSAANVPTDADLVVYSDAVPQGNPERAEAKSLNIPQMSYAEILGGISKTKRTIAISGTNGKSTTTAMIGLILEAAGFDPLVIVGSKVKTFGYGNLRMGAGEWLVVEGDEYRAHMLHLMPEIIVLTNIEEDHLDYFKDLDEIINSFKSYLELLPSHGLCVLNADDLGSKKLQQIFHSHVRTNVRMKNYGLCNHADYLGVNLREGNGLVQFDVKENDVIDLSCALQVPGRFNVYNALAAIACARALGIPVDVIQKTLTQFTSIWRRFEKIGEYNGALIISDYGHHPTAIKKTVEGARKFYPGRRIVLSYQPHQHHRTKALFNDFVDALATPDILILSEIYDVAGRAADEDRDVSSRQLIETITNLKVEKLKSLKAIYGGDIEETEKIVRDIVKKDDIVIIMGAGDIDKIARNLALK